MSDEPTTPEPATPAPTSVDSTRDDRDHGSRAGTTEGTATHLTDIIGREEPFENRPRASVVHEDESAKIVAFEFGEGHELGDHAAHHPVLVQVLRGRVEFGLPDRTVILVPGEVLHLTPRLRHSVRALEPTTLTVTMLLPRA